MSLLCLQLLGARILIDLHLVILGFWNKACGVCLCNCTENMVWFFWRRFHFCAIKLNKGFIILVAYCSRMQFCSIKFMSDVCLINGFIFLLSIKCFMTVDGQLQKETDKLDRNLPITMCHVALWPHLLVIGRSKKYKTSDCNMNLRVHMFMKGTLKIGW